MNFDFRKELTTVHESDIRCEKRIKKENEIEIKNGALIWMDKNADEVIKISVNDYIDYLKTSMGVTANLTEDKEKATITVQLAKDAGVDLGEVNSYRGFKIVTDEEKIEVFGFDERGASQALYYIEDLMTFEKAPVMAYGSISKKPAFSPQMVHSAYDFDEFPDDYLMRIAHEGRDAILVYAKDANMSKVGPIDFNELIARAKRYGLDVYAYSAIYSDMHPDEEGAEAYYDTTYGKLFRECPGLKGVTLVGESIEFPSKDPHVYGRNRFSNHIDGIPSGKPSPGWYPCFDYADWVNMVKKTVRKYNPDADIVFWTYNWGRRPKEARLKLLETLPTDITLEVTFEMGEIIDIYDAKGIVADYSISFAGPGQYFSSEAEVAKRRGIRLYSMTNTGGRTWDFGVIPYVPVPYQWINRYEKMLKAHDDWGLCGIMESHHYGFFPSIISKLSKHSFMEPRESMTDILDKIIASEYGRENLKTVQEAFEYISEAITYFTPSRSDQYGAFRVGPAYPLNLDKILTLPVDKTAIYGAGIYKPTYRNEAEYSEWPVSMRIKQEIRSLETMLELVKKAVKTLEKAENPNEKLKRLLNLFRYMHNTVITGIHAKKWHILICCKNLAETKEILFGIYDEMVDLLEAEIKNSEATIPLVEYDSAIGFEASMHYMGDKPHIEWKIRQIRYVIDAEIRNGREGASK